MKKQPYMTGLKVSQLTEEELAKYRELEPPKKEIDFETLAPRRVRGTAVATHKTPFGKWAKK
ncbi:hypothetical protein E0485_14615 [Paenibacillus albiflavus]|uniref:Uncharacterized protein n=1 Tax=Paenibacillus albiflavus TaxID=2545760 RepID=A0A4R4E8G4_9BACL|nr:hypothetical protein [Paenibacillus albiflavus]TCZ76076.1 hypothetical protein E0485_14615 [Paenibacillus albiflavus]